MDEDREALDADRSVEELQQEVERLAATNERLSSKLRRRGRIRTFLTGALVLVTALLFVASTVAVWGKRTVFDTDRFMGVVEPALDEPAFYDSLSRNISDQVLEALDLETRVRARLTQLDEFIAVELVGALDLRDSVRTALSLVDRPTLADLTPSIVDPLEQRVTDRIDGFITSEEFKARLPLLVRRAHEATLALIDGDLSDYPNVYIENGDVRLNLIPIIADALEPVIDTLRGYIPDIALPAIVSDRVAEGRQQLADSLRIELPDDFGQLTVISERSLGSLQDGARKVERAVWLVVLVTAVFLALTLVTAPDRRRALIWLSIGITAALALSWWIITRIRQAVLDEIVQPDSRAAIQAILRETGDSFRSYLLVALVIAVVAGLVAFIAAHLDTLAQGARWARRQVTEPTPQNEWVSAHYDVLRMAGFVLAAILLLWAGIAVVPFLVIGGLLGAYVLVLGAMRREHSDIAAASSDG